jgi:hypothetical protein
MRKADLVNQIAEKTGIPKVDVLVTLETMFKEVKELLRLDVTSKKTLPFIFLNIIFLLLSLQKNLLQR